VDEQEQAVEELRRRRSRAEAEQLVADYEASGLSRVEFCRTHGLSWATLARYRKWRQAGEAEGGNRLVAVELSGAKPVVRREAGLAMALPGRRRIEVERGFDARTLVQLLSVLERI
jgi:transposase-like protein